MVLVFRYKYLDAGKQSIVSAVKSVWNVAKVNMLNKSMVKLVSMVFVLMSLSTGLVTHPQDICGNSVTQIPNFNASQYVGHWYLHSKTYSNISDCDTVDFKLGEYGVMYTKYSFHRIRDHKEVVVSGAINPNTGNSGRMQAAFGNISSGDVYFADYVVLYTDYTNVAVVYSCGSSGRNNISILSRTPVLASNFVDTAKSIFALFGLDTSRLVISEQYC